MTPLSCATQTSVLSTRANAALRPGGTTRLALVQIWASCCRGAWHPAHAPWPHEQQLFPLLMTVTPCGACNVRAKRRSGDCLGYSWFTADACQGQQYDCQHAYPEGKAKTPGLPLRRTATSWCSTGRT